jgi:hypothetical protein
VKLSVQLPVVRILPDAEAHTVQHRTVQIQKDRTTQHRAKPEPRGHSNTWRISVSAPNLSHDLIGEGQNVFVGVGLPCRIVVQLVACWD